MWWILLAYDKKFQEFSQSLIFQAFFLNLYFLSCLNYELSICFFEPPNSVMIFPLFFFLKLRSLRWNQQRCEGEGSVDELHSHGDLKNLWGCLFLCMCKINLQVQVKYGGNFQIFGAKFNSTQISGGRNWSQFGIFCVDNWS